MGLERGLELIRAGAYFAAHEQLEDEWREAPREERDFLQGLVHVAVAWYQADRGNRPGCERQLAKAGRRLGRYAPAHPGLDVARVLRSVEGAAALVAAGTLELPSPDLQGLDTDPEPLEEPVQVDAQPPEAVEEEQRAERE